MEVEVLGVDGVPKDAIISIRAGASRRQAPVSSLGAGGQPFKFAGGPAGVNPFKLDVLQPIGSTRLALKPNGGTFSVPIKGAEGVTVNLAVREGKNNDQDLFDKIDANKDGVITRREFNEALRAEGDKPVLQPLGGEYSIPIVSPDEKNTLPPLGKAEDIRFPAAANAAKEYLELHKLLPFVRALLQTVVRERPDDPYNFIADQFRSAAPLQEEDVKSKAREALSNALLGDDEKAADVEAAKEKARDALNSALFGDGEEDDDDIEAAKQRARQALGKALLQPDDDEDTQDIEAAKQRARDALGRALLAPAESEEDLESAKEKARMALHSALLGGDDEEDEDVEAAKQKARDALASALLDSDEEDDVEEAKARARDALGAALIGGDVDEAKAMARQALSAALAPVDEDLEAAKENARQALAGALLQQASGPQDSGRGDDELSRAEKAKARLAATKDELSKMNGTLKSEISELNDFLSTLQAERDSLRTKFKGLQ